MITTYEIHDDRSENDDDAAAFDVKAVEDMNCWQKCFVPKYPIHRSLSEESETLSPPEVPQKRNGDDRPKESRCRFDSEDVTVLTNLTTPPDTPDGERVFKSVSIHDASNSSRNHNDSHDPSISNDLENSLRIKFSSIDEEGSEDRSSADDKENGQEIGTIRTTSSVIESLSLPI